MTAQFTQWQLTLGRRSGAPVTAILKRGDLPKVSDPPLLFVASSDAATDSSPPGMGFMHGYTRYLHGHSK